MATQYSDKLVIVNGMPAAEKLWNGRWRLEFFCDPSDGNTGWYKDNIDKWLPEFGALQDDATNNGWSYPSNSGVVYDDMRLVEAGTPFVPSASKHYVRLVYETLTSTLVAEVDDKEIEGENGLAITERTLIAKAGVAFGGTVGTSTYGGKTLIGYEVENTDAYTRVKARYSESGVISRSTDLVGSQQALVITSLGETPATPSGYSLAKTDVNNEEGFETTSYTFLKPSILSLQTPLVGGNQQVSVTAFSMTSAQVDSDLSEVTSNHTLIDESVQDYEGIETTRFVYEVDDFEVAGKTEDGFETLNRTELSSSSFTNGDIGVDTYSGLYLATENIDNGGSIKIRKSKWSAHGVISIRPIEGEEFSLASSYTYITLGAPASTMSGLTKPDGTALGASVTWFEPSVQNIEGLPTYSQDVLTATLSGDEVRVDSYDKFFTITDPGVMSTSGAANSEAKSGGAVRYPEAISQPQTYRKKATVDVYLTTSSTISETEVAYTEEDVNWCSISFSTFYNNMQDSSSSVSANWRSFPQFLNSSGTTDTASASSAGEYFAEASSYGSGDTTYTTSGIYRVELDKYQRKADATQLYLRTVITFA